MINETPMSAPEITIGHFLPILGTSIVAEAARVAVTPGRSGKISSHPGPSWNLQRVHSPCPSTTSTYISTHKTDTFPPDSAACQRPLLAR